MPTRVAGNGFAGSTPVANIFVCVMEKNSFRQLRFFQIPESCYNKEILRRLNWFDSNFIIVYSDATL